MHTQIAKIEVLRDNNSLVIHGESRNLEVRGSMMRRSDEAQIMSGARQGLSDESVDAFVHK